MKSFICNVSLVFQCYFNRKGSFRTRMVDHFIANSLAIFQILVNANNNTINF
jgi:hypothetical protein